EYKEIEVSEKLTKPCVAMHIAVRIQMDQKPNARYYKQHNGAQWIEEKGERKFKIAYRNPVKSFEVESGFLTRISCGIHIGKQSTAYQKRCKYDATTNDTNQRFRQ